MKVLKPQPGVWLLPLFHLFSQAEGFFWTVTSRYQLDQSVETFTYGTSEDLYTYSTTRTLSSGVTPTAVPVSTTTYEDRYDDVETVLLYYTPGAVPESQLEPTEFRTTTADATSTYTVFQMPIVYTAPATCTSNFTFTTTTYVYIPFGVEDQLKPTSVEAGPPNSYSTRIPTVTVTWYLTEGAAPHSTSTDFIYTYYIRSCSKPYSYNYGGGDKDNGDDDGHSYTYSYCYAYCSTFKTWIIVIATILPAFFLLGFLESWFWFRRLMTGRSALRLGTCCWVCISLWVLCFTRKQDARSAEDQKLLQEQWRNIPTGTAFKLWWKWGFRQRYPTELLGQFSTTTTGINPQGGAATAAGQPTMQQQYGHVATPPSAYLTQPGGPPGVPQYYDATKDGASVTTQQVYAPGQVSPAQYPYPGQYQPPPQPGQFQQGPVPGQPPNVINPVSYPPPSVSPVSGNLPSGSHTTPSPPATHPGPYPLQPGPHASGPPAPPNNP